MKAVTIAAAGAALIGTVAASSHVENIHKQLNARSGWSDWSSDPVAESTTKPKDPTKPVKITSTKPAAETTPSKESTWEDWTSTTSSDPVKITSTKPAAETTPSEESTWEDWTSTTSSDPVKITSTKPADETTDYSVTWEDWSTTTSSDPVKITSTSSDPVESHTWADWESSSSPVEITSTTYDPSHTWADWESSSSPVEITSTTYDPSHTWADWESSSSPVEITSTSYDPSHTWADWESSTVVKSGTTTTTIYLGKPTDPGSVPADLASTAATTTWADWSTTPAVETSTATPSSVAPVWSSDGWFGPGWGADGQCAIQVVTSYGSPIWAATPDATMPVLSVTVSPTGPYEDPATTTWADWTSSDPAVETSTSTSETWADWSSTSSDPAVVTSTTETWADWSSTSSDPAVVTSTSSTETWADWSAAPTGGLGNSGNTWGMTYSPYTSEGGCKDASTVTADLAVIAGKGFSTVRVYSTDCDTLENVGTAAKEHGLKLILGVFISSTGINGAKEQVWDIIGWAQWELVELIVVGNEAVFNGFCSASDLAGFIAESADFFKKAGYTGPVTTTEPLAEWLKDGSTFCSVIDVVAANLYAFFNAEVTADKAGDFIQRQIKELESVCPGKDTYVMESGWPHAGKCNGAACPSPENQATALKSIEEVTGSNVIFFSYEDEAWKEPGEFDVEQYWGCAGVF